MGTPSRERASASAWRWRPDCEATPGADQDAVGGRHVTEFPLITTWPPETREHVAAAILDAALPTCTYPPAVGEQYIDPLSDVVLDFLAQRLSPVFAVLKVIY